MRVSTSDATALKIRSRRPARRPSGLTGPSSPRSCRWITGLRSWPVPLLPMQSATDCGRPTARDREVKHEFLAVVLATGRGYDGGNLSRTSIRGFSVCTRDGVHHQAFRPLRASVISPRLYVVVPCHPLARPAEPLAVVEPPLLWARLRLRHGLAPRIGGLFGSVFREPAEFHRDRA